VEATRQAGKAASAAGHRLRQLRRWARRPLARNLLIASVVALALLVFLSSLRHRPSQPFRTPEVAAALKRARDRTGPDPGPVVSLSAAPRLALVGPGLGDTKLALETRVPPPAPERPAEQAEDVVARPPAPPVEMRPLPQPAAVQKVVPPPPPAPLREVVPEAPPPRPAAPDPPPPLAATPDLPPPAVVAALPSVEAALPATPVPLQRLPVPEPIPRPVPAPSIQPVAAIVRPPAPPAFDAPRLAIIIDDLGYDQGAARRAIALSPAVTLAFLPYGFHLPELTAAAAARGHDVFLHLPMEPTGKENPGANALLTSLQPAEVSRRLAWAFDHVPRAVGVNNHMGSRGTADPALMLAVLSEVRRRGLVFVDSRTTGASVAPTIAERLGVPIASRDVFLDNIPTSSVVLAQREAAERVARRRGSAIAIGHPFPATLAALADWLPAAERRGLRLVTARSLTTQGEPCAVTVSSNGGC
jgi:uncharacterized protein